MHIPDPLLAPRWKVPVQLEHRWAHGMIHSHSGEEGGLKALPLDLLNKKLEPKVKSRNCPLVDKQCAAFTHVEYTIHGIIYQDTSGVVV